MEEPLQDATPITLEQEFSGFAKQIENCLKRIKSSKKSYYILPKVGRRWNRRKLIIKVHKRFIKAIQLITNLPFKNQKINLNHFQS